MKPINYPIISLALSSLGLIRYLLSSPYEYPENWEVMSTYLFVLSIGALVMGLIFLWKPSSKLENLSKN